jgi:hypothetical protein
LASEKSRSNHCHYFVQLAATIVSAAALCEKLLFSLVWKTGDLSWPAPQKLIKQLGRLRAGRRPGDELRKFELRKYKTTG